WLEHLNYNAKQGFFSITFVAHPHSRWFIVSHVLRAQLTEVINIDKPTYRKQVCFFILFKS
ncbi:hypothetical protein K2V56_10285, partial [Staphylococcus chromogenes]|uniref:hypothetical protein n=1 Tax=Staphylococcus chromogenes TaxID=46126 RepID=UPI001E554712